MIVIVRCYGNLSSYATSNTKRVRYTSVQYRIQYRYCRANTAVQQYSSTARRGEDNITARQTDSLQLCHSLKLKLKLKNANSTEQTNKETKIS